MSADNLSKIYNSDSLIWNNRFFPNKIVPDEDMILVVRQDISIIGFSAIGYLFVFFGLVIGRLVVGGIADFVYIAAYDTVMYSVNMILVLLFTFTFHNYYLSMQAVTNKRIIDIHQRSIFNRSIDEMSIDKIQDVNHSQPNFIAVLFGYGTVTIQTASDANDGSKSSEDEGVTFENVPSPASIATTLSGLYHTNKGAEQVQAAKLNAQYMIDAQRKAAQERHQQINNIYSNR